MQSRPTIRPPFRPSSLMWDSTDTLQIKKLTCASSPECFPFQFPDSAYGSRETSPAISRTFELLTNNSFKIEEPFLALSCTLQHASSPCVEETCINSHDDSDNQDLCNSEALWGDINKLPFYGVIGDGRPCAPIPAMATAAYVDEMVSSDANTLPTNTTSSIGNGPIYRYKPQRKRASPLFWTQDISHILKLPGHEQRGSKEAKPGNSNNIGSTSLLPGLGSCTISWSDIASGVSEKAKIMEKQSWNGASTSTNILSRGRNVLGIGEVVPVIGEICF